MNKPPAWKKLKEFDNHERIEFFSDKRTGLQAFIAIHNTNLGPATGGTRYGFYQSQTEALRDALKLSRAMTYKCALAGVPFGGGKGVIMARGAAKSKSLLEEYARKVNLFKGSFTTGEDVGIAENDIKIMARISPYINCRPEKGGNPAPWAARGVFYAIQTALKSVFGYSGAAGRKFAIKGLGNVGYELCRLIYEQSGEIAAADINPERTKYAKKHFPKIKIVPASAIFREIADVYCPCALGGDFTNRTIPFLNCRIICGAANNQLWSKPDGEKFHKRNILYIPDYVSNAGGLINVAAELDPRGYERKRVEKNLLKIKKTIEKIISISGRKKISTNQVADRLAEKIIYKK
jgi:leucine dehydrogenase